MDIEEIQSNRAVDLLARNKQQAERITELESRIADSNSKTKEQIAEIETKILALQASNERVFLQIEADLKLVKLHFC